MRLIDIVSDLKRRPRRITLDESLHLDRLATRMRTEAARAAILIEEGLTPETIANLGLSPDVRECLDTIFSAAAH